MKENLKKNDFFEYVLKKVLRSIIHEKVIGKEVKEMYKIDGIIGQYHSPLEHTFIWIVEADDAHLIEKFRIEIEMARFKTVKIVPSILFEDIVNK